MPRWEAARCIPMSCRYLVLSVLFEMMQERDQGTRLQMVERGFLVSVCMESIREWGLRNDQDDAGVRPEMLGAWDSTSYSWSMTVCGYHLSGCICMPRCGEDFDCRYLVFALLLMQVPVPRLSWELLEVDPWTREDHQNHRAGDGEPVSLFVCLWDDRLLAPRLLKGLDERVVSLVVVTW